MSEPALDRAASLLARRVGLRPDPTIRSRLVRSVQDEARRHGQTVGDYVVRLEHDRDALQDLLNRVTVQETAFFRDPGQFAALATHVLPALARAGGPVRVWSAGCANGQEAWSLAMTLAESGIADWQVVASDLSTDALERTRAARYTEREARGLSADRRARFCEHLPPDRRSTLARGDALEWEIVPRLRQRVTVVRHNLAADALPLPTGACHVVFCRNVLIYFGRADAVRFLERLSPWLAEGGLLFLGYSESLWQVTDRFDLVRLGDAFAYRPTRPGERPRPPAAPAAPARVPTGASDPAMAERLAREGPPAPARVPTGARYPATAGYLAPDAKVEPDVGGDGAGDRGDVGDGGDLAGDAGVALAEGEAALGSGDLDAAVRAFRRAVYLDPDHPVAHLHLGLALEAVGEPVAARRAFAAARAALARTDAAAVEALLEGYQIDDLVRLLDHKASQG